MPGSHSITLFPTATKGAGWFPHKETDYNAFWIILGANSFPSFGWRMESTCLKAESKDHPLGWRRRKEGWYSVVPLHDGCKSSEAVLFPCTEQNCTTVPSKAAQAKNWLLVSSRRQLSFGLFLIFLLPEWFREGIFQWQVCCPLPTLIKNYQIYFLGLHLMQKTPKSAEGQGHFGAINSYVYVLGFQDTCPKFC